MLPSGDSGGGGGVAGIALPPGEPGAVRDAANGLRGVGSGFQTTAETANAAAASVSWSGVAASAFTSQTGDFADAGRMAGQASTRAASVLDQFADRLEQGRERVRRLQDRAEEVLKRMQTAQAAAADAAEAESAALTRAQGAMASTSAVDAGAGAMVEHDAAVQEASGHATERAAQEDRAAAAADELQRLRDEAEQEREAVEEAATAAAGRLTGAEDAMPVMAGGVMIGSQGDVEERVLAGVRAGDYSVLEGVPFDSLDEGTQTAVGQEVARDAQDAAYGVEGADASIEEIAGVADTLRNDGEFATGFYNYLGGGGARNLATGIIFTQSTGKGLDDPALVAMMAPFASLLGTATRSGGLRRSFTDDFLQKDVPVRDRYPGLTHMEAFVMAGSPAGYSPDFLAAVGEEVLITPNMPENPDDGVVHHELSDHQDLMEFISANPEASAVLLAGSHGPDDHFSNVAPLLMYGPRYGDDGEALGALLRAGTHDALATEHKASAMTAAENVIRATPTFADHMPDGARPALVTILDDHVVGFEHAAADAAYPEENYELGDNIDISYGEGNAYLEALLRSDVTRDQTIAIVGGRVGDNVYEAAGTPPGVDKEELQVRAGALQQLGVEAGIDADISDAEDDQKEAEIKQFFVEKAVGAGGGRILEKLPGSDILVGQAIEGAIPTDQVEKALEQARRSDLAADEKLRLLLVAAEVQHGNLPVDVLLVENPDGGGSDSYDIVAGGDGDTEDRVAYFDKDGDGSREWVTEGELRSVVNENVESTTPADTKAEIQMIDDALENPPGLSDFSDALPEGYSHDGNWIFGDDLDGPGDSEPDYEIQQSETRATLTIRPSGADAIEVAMVWSESGGWVPAQ